MESVPYTVRTPKTTRSPQEMEQERLLFLLQTRCLTVLRWFFVVGIPFTIVNISFCCVYAWIYANQVKTAGRVRWKGRGGERGLGNAQSLAPVK